MFFSWFAVLLIKIFFKHIPIFLEVIDDCLTNTFWLFIMQCNSGYL